MSAHVDYNDTRSSQNANLPASREARSVAHRTELAQAMRADPETANSTSEPNPSSRRGRQFGKRLMAQQELERLVVDGPANLRPIAQGALIGCFGFLQIRAGMDVTATKIKKLGGRWIATLDDRDPALGPAGFANRGLPRLVTRATAGIVDPGERSADFYRSLIVSAIMGARIVIVKTDPSQNETWAEFLEFYTLEAAQYLMQKVLNEPGK